MDRISVCILGVMISPSADTDPNVKPMAHARRIVVDRADAPRVMARRDSVPNGALARAAEDSATWVTTGAGTGVRLPAAVAGAVAAARTVLRCAVACGEQACREQRGERRRNVSIPHEPTSVMVAADRHPSAIWPIAHHTGRRSPGQPPIARSNRDVSSSSHCDHAMA